jgi:hypothetical protein
MKNTALVAGLLLAAACGGGDSPVTPTPITCSYSVPTATVQVAASGQSFVVPVDTTASCAWTATPSAPWISVAPASSTGAASVTVTIAANDATNERAADITIAGKVVPVRQAGRSVTPCTYALHSTSSTLGADGGKARVTVDTAAGCAWTASSTVSWIAIRTVSGSGPGDIEYEVPAYTGTEQRSGQIVAGTASFTVRQDPPSAPCTYGVDPTSVVLHWHGAEGDGMEVRLTTLGHCSWTASPGAPWVELLTAASGTGPATMRVRVNAYTNEATRSAPLMIRWPTPTAGQNVSITQSGCRYALGPNPDNVTATGGRRSVSVFGDPATVDCMVGCPWTISNVPGWIHVSGSTTRAGDDVVFYDVDANTTGATRTGTMTIGPLTLTVVQGG